MNRLLAQLKIHEGFRGQCYQDSVGVSTIGYGRNLRDNPLTEEEATYLLKRDIKRTRKALVRAKPAVAMVSSARRDALVDMAFNLGVRGLLRFSRMWAAIEQGRWSTAAQEALDSHWARQVGTRRSGVLANMIETGEWADGGG
jgi:lysozyme